MDRGRFLAKRGREPDACGEAERRSPQFGFARKPLNSHNSGRKKLGFRFPGFGFPFLTTWIFLPLGFENPPMHLQVECFT